nr:envelope stress response membrane protein PspB [Thalassotalea atypica]
MVEEIIVAPIIIFMLVVAPIWLILHYRSKRQISQGLTEEEYNQLSDLSEMADKMADRIKTLEAILDAETPDWRSKV